MSETTGTIGTSTMPTTNFKSVASIENLHVSHDIVISDFVDWRDNADFFGKVTSSFTVPSTDATGKETSKVYTILRFTLDILW